MGSIVSGWTKNTQTPKFLEKKQKKSSKTKKLKNVLKYGKISNTPFDKRSLIHREAWFPPRQNQPEKKYFFCLAILDHFQKQTSYFNCLFWGHPWLSLTLEGIAGHGGQFLTPAEGFGLSPRLVCPSGRKERLLCCFLSIL